MVMMMSMLELLTWNYNPGGVDSAVWAVIYSMFFSGEQPLQQFKQLVTLLVGWSVGWSVPSCDNIFILYSAWLDLILYIIRNIFNMVGFNSVHNSGKWLDFSVKNNQKTLLFATRGFSTLFILQSIKIKTFKLNNEIFSGGCLCCFQF